MQPATITIQPATITIQPATATAQQDPKNTQPDSTSSTSADQSSAPITTGSTISDAKPTSGPMLTTSVPNLTASVTIATSQPEVTTSVTQSTLPVATTTATSWALTTAVITSATLILATMEMKVRKEIEEKVDIFAEAGTQFFNTAQKVLEKLTELFDTLADAVNNLEVSQVSTIDLPEAHIQYANLPDVTYWRDAVKERPGDRVRLLELTPLPVNKRKKRSSDSVHFVYALFFFDLHKMLALHSLQPKTTSAMWTPTTHSLLYPSEEAPYIRIQLEEHGGKSIAAKLKFQINMTADDMFEKEIPQKMSRAADDSIPRSYACLRRVDTVNGTFSPHDCSSVTTDTGMVTCSCNKTGFFTVSAQVATQSRPEAWDLLCLLISILGLILLFLATIALVGMHGEVINDRIVVQINLVLSLFLLHCVLFFERSSSNQKTPCVAVMFLIHFFMLATACFAVVESFTILSNLHTEALKWKRLNKCPLVIIQILAGWVLPLTIAAITISVNLPNNAYLAYQQHGTDRCWFKADSGVLVAAVTVPIATCFSICFVVGLVTLCLSLRAKRSVPRHKNLARRYDVIDVGDVDMPHERRMLVEHILACVSLLVPWIFYFIFGISNLNTSLAMMYWSTVLISTQGIFVFVAYIIVSKDTRKILVGKVQYPGQLNLYWHGPQRKGEAIPRKASSRRLRRSGSSARSKIGLRSPKRSAHTNFGKW
uniref:Adhesion G-protein coupled receptor D1-like n=1 Tax=Phallusia mammillata TaxID=59560 RepID=A0A6F9D6J1_9ASCI|nr:adhesion G-protein coupled receptor D1-like [Phallusia mammillata]